jgi:hypothetical protein
LEGELVFSLFEGQHIIDYALQINGKYRQASVVPKAKATEAYESTVRAQIDPSVLEKTIGNNFKARLYPIPSKGYKKIKITLQESLDNKNKKFQFRIPLVTKHALKKLKVSIDMPSLISKPHSNFTGFQFDKTSQGQFLKFEKGNTKITKPITITFDSNVQEKVYLQKISNQSYIFSSLDFKEKKTNTSRLVPKNIAILWNNSLSNRSRNFDKEMQFLNQYLQKVGTAQVNIVFLNNHTTQKNIGKVCAHEVACNNGHFFSFLRNQLKSEHFDGTSDYSKFNLNKLNVDEILMFSRYIVRHDYYCISCAMFSITR